MKTSTPRPKRCSNCKKILGANNHSGLCTLCITSSPGRRLERKNKYD